MSRRWISPTRPCYPGPAVLKWEAQLFRLFARISGCDQEKHREYSHHQLPVGARGGGEGRGYSWITKLFLSWSFHQPLELEVILEITFVASSLYNSGNRGPEKWHDVNPGHMTGEAQLSRQWRALVRFNRNYWILHQRQNKNIITINTVLGKWPAEPVS